MTVIPIKVTENSNAFPLESEQARVIRAVSPTIDAERTEASATLTIHDIDGTKEININDGEKGDKGEPGKDGVSPTATVTQTETGALITVTDADGTTIAEIKNGENGEPGVPGAPGADGVGVPAGGTTGQVLSKASGTDYDTEWTTPSDSPVQDVQVNGVSVLQDGVANVPEAVNNGGYGVVKISSGNGVSRAANGYLYVVTSTDAQVKSGSISARPISPLNQHLSTFYGLAKAAGADMGSTPSTTVGVYPEAQKSAISQMLNSPVIIFGTTPAITALPGVRYVCGEVATLDITLPESGIVDVTFESGSTPTVLTITPPTGVTLRWANGFDPTALEANTTYEIRVRNGQLASALAWA